MAPLYKAAKSGNLQLVKFLLSKGAEVDSSDNVSSYIHNNDVMYCIYNDYYVPYIQC